MGWLLELLKDALPEFTHDPDQMKIALQQV